MGELFKAITMSAEDRVREIVSYFSGLVMDVLVNRIDPADSINLTRLFPGMIESSFKLLGLVFLLSLITYFVVNKAESKAKLINIMMMLSITAVSLRVLRPIVNIIFDLFNSITELPLYYAFSTDTQIEVWTQNFFAFIEKPEFSATQFGLSVIIIVISLFLMGLVNTILQHVVYIAITALPIALAIASLNKGKAFLGFNVNIVIAAFIYNFFRSVAYAFMFTTSFNQSSLSYYVAMCILLVVVLPLMGLVAMFQLQSTGVK